MEWLCVGGDPGPRIRRHTGHETEPGGAREALGNAAKASDDLYHIFDSVLQFDVVGIRAISADRALEGGKFLLDIWHKSEEVLRKRR